MANEKTNPVAKNEQRIPTPKVSVPEAPEVSGHNVPISSVSKTPVPVPSISKTAIPTPVKNAGGVKKSAQLPNPPKPEPVLKERVPTPAPKEIVSDTEQQKESSPAPVPYEKYSARTYAKDMARARGENGEEVKEPAPEQEVKKERPGIPLNLVVMRREGEKKTLKEKLSEKLRGLTFPKFPKKEARADLNEHIVDSSILREPDEKPKRESGEADETEVAEIPLDVDAEIKKPGESIFTKEEINDTDKENSSSLAPLPVKAESFNTPEQGFVTPKEQSFLRTPAPTESVPTPILAPVSKPTPIQTTDSAHTKIATPAKVDLSKNARRDSSVASPIHTYKSDFVDRIHETGATDIDVLTAEQNAGVMHIDTEKESHGNTLLFAIGGILLFTISVLGIIFAYQYRTKINSAPVVSKVPSLVATDAKLEISGSGKTLLRAIAEASLKPIQNNTFVLLYVSNTATSTDGTVTSTFEKGGKVIASLPINMPALLARTIKNDSSLGLVRARKEIRPFFVLHVGSYDSAFAGMLRWEKTIQGDLGLLYPNYTYATEPNSTTTPTNIKISFKDEIVSNHDTRILRDRAGNSILLYGFWNKNILIIARNPVAFAEIISRLGNSSTQ